MIKLKPLKLIKLLGITILTAAVALAQNADITDTTTIDYKTVDEAFQSLKNNSNITLQLDPIGWLYGVDQTVKDQVTFWTFTPEGHPADPSVVKRTLIKKDGEVKLQMAILCQAEQTAYCTTLKDTFDKLNNEIIAKNQ